MNEDWDGTERRHAPMEDLVTRAASVAAQKVGGIHRRRLVVWSFLAALLASAAVCVPVVLIAAHRSNVSSRNNSQFNCDLFTDQADLFAAFLVSDANLRYRQQHYRERQRVLTAFSTIIEPKLLKQLQADSDRVDRHARRFWKLRLAPAMRNLAKINCATALNGRSRTVPASLKPKR